MMRWSVTWRTNCNMAMWTCCSMLLLLLLVVVVPYCSAVDSSFNDKIDNHWLDRQLENLLDADRDTSQRCSRTFTNGVTQWINKLDATYGSFQHQLAIANWNYLTNLTKTNAKALEKVQGTYDDWLAGMLPKARRYKSVSKRICNSTTRRLLDRLVKSNTIPVADSPDTRMRINHLMTSLENIFNTAVVYDDSGKKYRLDPELNDIMAKSRDYDQLLWAWEAWNNATGPRLKSKFVELVDGMNEAARDNGFADVGVVWKVADFDDPNIERKMDRLYADLKPLYQHLHAYVRRKLIAAYPNHGINPTGPIPAHLLGDMWAQQWANIIDLLTPYPDVQSVNVTAALHDAKFTVLDMFRTAEEFYTSLGLEPMTSDFWSKSVLVRPSDGREIACHASAHDFYSPTDFRIKMCTHINGDEFNTVHHEMGHIEYFMQYRNQLNLFRAGANAAFHEAIGDTITLSLTTTKHLTTIGLISTPSSTNQSSTNETYEKDINFLLEKALSKVAFIPFAYVLDKFRYRVFRGDTPPDLYNIDWNKLRTRYQGITNPVRRPADFFDAGSKYHVPANVPYSRYFFSFIGQFQFHSALCKLAGHTGPLHKCDIYRSTEAGNMLKSVLNLGSSRPWPEVMQLFTGQREFQTDAMKEYFQPLYDWLRKENEGFTVGW